MIGQQLKGFREIFNTLPSGMVIYNPTDKTLEINSRGLELLHLGQTSSATAPQTTVKTLGDLPDYLVEMRVLLDKAEEDIPRSEINLILPGSREATVIGFTLKHILNDAGHPLKILVFSDITQIVQDRLAMDRIKEELFQSKKLASIGTMISGVAHELNNPLTGISMSTQLSQMSVKAMIGKLQKSTEAQQNPESVAPTIQALERTLKELEKIAKESQKASVLVSDLLNYSKPTKLELVVTQLSSLVTEVVGALRTHPEFAQFSFYVTPCPPEVSILCDRVKVEQVFYNLFKNACDATGGKGEATVSFYLDKAQHTESGGMVVINVTDNGPGMEKSVLNRIFDPFFTTKGAKGVGLGLSISYRTIEQHGGLLSVESEPGVGTTFHIALPVFVESDELR